MSENTEPRKTERASRPPQQREASRRGGPHRRRRGRRRRGKTTYCPKGRCFDYKDLDMLSRYVNESGKIKPRRQTGNCSRCQRELAREIKRARHIALLPYVVAD
ncbi:MAG: 30S ribosomal protein S18 [Chloroflexi bacterium]|nr:30S ribosomal protein S18 [Chloroflexota bacterium]